MSKHSYVPFYFDKWMGGTAGMNRVMWSVYFQVCLYNWDKCRPVPLAYMEIVTADLEGIGLKVVQKLIDMEKIALSEDGQSVYSEKALEEGLKALDLFTKKSRGGQSSAPVKSAKKVKEIDTSKTLPTEKQESSIDKNRLDKIREEDKSSSKKGGANENSPPTPPFVEDDLEELEAIKRIQAAKVKRKEINAGLKRICDAWNAMAATCGLPQIEKLTDSRKGHLESRLAEHGADKIIAGIATVPKSKFLLGQNDRKWRADFDWLVRPDRCAKLIEGGYLDDAEAKAKPKPDAKPLAPIVDVEGEPEVCGKIRRQLLATIGIPAYCAFANGVKIIPEPESRAIRIDGPTAVRLKDDYGPLLKKIIAPLGYSEIW